jgi:tetratricopeptide (TPR) repeat protein
VHRFHEQIAATPHTWIEAAAGPFFQNTPFYPVADMLKQALAWRGNESAQEQLTQLESSLVLAGLNPAQAVPLIGPLLDLPLPPKYPPSALSPEQQRRRLLATLVELALGTAQVQPTVITTEDLHWADASTLELIQLLVEQGARARLLLLYTARPEFRAQWPLRAHHTQITLNRLSSRNVRTMVGQVAARTALSEKTIAAMVERTGGVPLFVEELTRAVIESGDAKLTGREIPVTLHDSLMARLDRLGPAKEVIQVGAVIGGEFSYDMLHAVHPIAEEELQRALRNLSDAELLYVRGIAPEATYLFKHALIRDAAYEGLLKSRRKDLHGLVARTIDEKFPAQGEAHPEVLARHWTEAGEIEPAIAQWSRAGKAAETRNAFREALESYQRALALLNTLPESSGRDLRELELRQSLYFMLFVTSGSATPETIDATERLAALAEKSGNLARLVGSVNARCYIAMFSGDLAAAVMLADQALELALRDGSPEGLAGVYAMQVLAREQLGDLAGAEKHFTSGRVFFEDPGFRLGPRRVLLIAFTAASWNAWKLGRADVARERMAQMMAAVNRNDSYEVAFSAWCAAVLSGLMREYEQAEALAARALELSDQNQFPQIAAMSRCILGAALAQIGRATEGVELIRQGIAGSLEVGQGRGLISTWTANLARAQERAGASVEALATVEQALQADPRNNEALRLRGELRLKKKQTELAEADFREAIALARGMGAKAWELRATTSLANLLAKQGRRDEARSMLAEIYGWFTEGFDTADLKDAKALLEELEA